MRALACALALVVVGCTCLPADPTGEKYVCTNDGDCLDGWSCRSARCVRDGAGGGAAGGGAAGGATAGGAATAGGGTAGGATAGGATAGGATAGGATAGGATAGGATAGGGTAGGGTAGGSVFDGGSFCNDITLMGCWPMNEGSGVTVNDGSPNNNAGLINGATWVNTDAGVALSFSGASDQNVTVPDSNSLTSPNAITLEAWIRPSAVGTDATVDRIIDKGINDEYQMGIGTIGGPVVGSIDNQDAPGTVSPVVGAWQHVAVTWSAGAPIRVFVNGVLTNASPQVMGPMMNSPRNVVLGNATTAENASTRFQGQLNRVRVYSRAKTSGEICTAAGRVWNGALCM